VVPLPEHICIFPLGEVVLFPDTLLPLHIFEPRYRKMLADALEGDRTIGMVLIRDGEPSGNPEIYPIGCAGEVVEHEALEDGRSIIILRGTVKFRVRRELETDEPYRMIETQALYEAPVPAEQMRGWRSDLRSRMEAYVRALGGEPADLDKLFGRTGLEGIVNYLSASLPLAVVEKQSLLECATAEQRYRRLCELIDFKTAEARLGMSTDRDADA
jgi:Lon protease-like protein